jgi:hypothetical protein
MMDDVKRELVKEEIEHSANNAVKIIAQAAAEATKVIAEAAAVSVKVLAVKNEYDHDLLIELKTRMEGLKVDIRDLNEGTSIKITDHEKRLFDLEKTKNSQTILLTIGIGILSILSSLVIYHIIK